VRKQLSQNGSPSVAEVAAEAEVVAAGIAERLAARGENRFQGMPSDGDSDEGYAALGAAGLIGLHWPREAGGRGLTPLHTIAVEERLGYHWLPLSGYLLSVKTIGNALLRFAPRLASELLPGIAAGRTLFCQGFSEPDAGSDLASLRTRAQRQGDVFVVNGRKLWTSSAEHADLVYLAVRTDPEAPRHRGLSVLIAPMDTPGIAVSTHATLGGGTLGELALDDVEIPASGLVGELHGGWRVLMGTLDHERVTSEKVGVVLRLLDDLEPHVETPAARRTFRRLRGEAEAARLHGRHATELLAAGGPASAASSMAKLSVALLMQRLAAAAAELLGPQALIEDGPGAVLDGRVAAFHRAAVATTISGGTAEIQRRVIARTGLGCPA
jgi:alkylation response protein AidB-like acyl-CoA dehydrogenase